MKVIYLILPCLLLSFTSDANASAFFNQNKSRLNMMMQKQDRYRDAQTSRSFPIKASADLALKQLNEAVETCRGSMKQEQFLSSISSEDDKDAVMLKGFTNLQKVECQNAIRIAASSGRALDKLMPGNQQAGPSSPRNALIALKNTFEEIKVTNNVPEYFKQINVVLADGAKICAAPSEDCNTYLDFAKKILDVCNDKDKWVNCKNGFEPYGKIKAAKDWQAKFGLQPSQVQAATGPSGDSDTSGSNRKRQSVMIRKK
jgi:hypothetical protein